MSSNSILSYNKQIDGLRCFAVLGVLVCHFLRFDNEIINRIPFGQGVNLFFVLSGYLITKILLVNKQQISEGNTSLKTVVKSFFFRRSIRIFPIYYITIIFLMIINFQNIWDVWEWLLTYTTNFYIANSHHPYSGSFSHLWSLAVEEQFYLIWPFIILFLPKKHIEKFIVGLILSSLIFKIALHANGVWSTAINAITLGCADALGFGALIAYWSMYRPSWLTAINRWKVIVLFSFLPYVFFIIYPRSYEWMIIPMDNFIFSVFAFFVVIKASQQKYVGVVKFLFENKVAIRIGKISYGIYLYHLFMPDLYNKFIQWFPGTFSSESGIRIPFLFIASIVIAQISWLLVEKPINRLKAKYAYSGKQG